jgi:hypothetical protein
MKMLKKVSSGGILAGSSVSLFAKAKDTSDADKVLAKELNIKYIDVQDFLTNNYE